MRTTIRFYRTFTKTNNLSNYLMATHKQFHFSTKLNEAIIRGGLYKSSPHCIAQKFSKETFSSVLEKISKKVSPSPIYAVSNDWIGSLSTSISQELSKSFNAPPENFVETSRSISNIISAIGNGTWSSGFTPVNAIKDLEANLPLYISDYFDQLAGWSREHVFDQSKNKIGSNINELQNKNPYPAESPFGLESALSDTFVKISWKFPVFDIHRPFNTDSNAPIFGLKGEPSSGEVYRYFAFIDTYKLAISMNEDGSISKKLYNFTDPAQLWRVENYGKFYALYNKKYKKYLGGTTLKGVDSKPDNNWNESALYIVEDTDTFNFSIGYTRNNTTFEYPDILKELTLVTIPLVAWRNPSGQFLNVDASHKTLGFSNGEQHDNVIVPKSEQLFLFVPHPDFANKAVVIDHDGQFLEFNPLSINKPSVYDFKSPSKFPFVLFEYEQNIWPWSANYLASHLQQHLITAPAPPPGEGTRVRVWKSDPSVKKVGIRELYFTTTSINTGPVDSLLQTVSTTQPIAPDSNGDFLLDFDDVPSQIPETDNHVRFDVVHTFSVVRYVYDLLSGDLQYLDGRPPVLKRPWGENKRLSIYPHAGEQANAFYNRSDASLRFFYIKRQDGTPVYLCRSLDIVSHETGHSFLDILQPNWLTGTGQSGAFHEAFGDLCSLFTLISMADIADLFITLTKANLRDPDNFISAVGEEFGDAIYNNRGKGLRNLTDPIKGSQANPEVHSLSVVFSGFYYDVLVDVFALERNPSIKSDTETLMDVGTNLRRALIIAIRVSSAVPTRTKFQEVATNLETSIGTLGRRLGVDLTNWQQIVRTKAKERELSIAGFGKK